MIVSRLHPATEPDSGAVRFRLGDWPIRPYGANSVSQKGCQVPLHVKTASPRAVMIYRGVYLPISETFVADHINGLRNWKPVPTYARLTGPGRDAADTPAISIYAGGGGKLARFGLHRFGFAPALARALQDRGVRLIHAHFLHGGAAIGQFALRAKLPLIVTAHGYDATQYPAVQRQYKDGAELLRMQPVLQRYATIICVSEFIRRELLSRGYRPERLMVNPLGIPLDEYRPGPAASLRRGVLYAGRLSAKKGVAWLLRAWTLLPSKLRSERLTIIGGGEQEKALQRFASDQGISATFTGPQERHAIRDAMLSHRALAFPSLRAADGDAEGMGLVAMEAQAVGTPVVAFDDGPASEVINSGHTGLLAAPGNPADYAMQLARVLTDDALADRLGAAGPGWVAEQFDIQKSNGRLEAIYDQVSAGLT